MLRPAKLFLESRNKWVGCFVSGLYQVLLAYFYTIWERKKKKINGSFTIFVLETVLAEGKHFHADFLFLNLNALQHQRSFRNIFITQMILFIYLFFYSFHAFKCDILPRLCMK